MVINRRYIMIFSSKELELTVLDPLVSRKVLPCGEDLMMVEVHFKKGGVGTPHAHTGHGQMSYVLSGRFEAIIGDEVKVLEKGDGFVADKNILHGLKALEDSVVLDVFTPIRADFL